jgi:hypothetical protein
VTPIAPVLTLVAQHLGPAEQGGGQGESLAHAEREPAGTLPGGDLEPDDREDLVDPPYRDAAQRSGGPHMVACGPAGCMHRASSTDPTTRAGVARSV